MTRMSSIVMIVARAPFKVARPLRVIFQNRIVTSGNQSLSRHSMPRKYVALVSPGLFLHKIFYLSINNIRGVPEPL